MANKNDKYSFEGDASSLAAAIKQSIELLKSYAKQMSSIQASGDFKGSVAAANKLTQAFAAAATQLKNLQSAYKGLDAAQFKNGKQSFTDLQVTIKDLMSVMQRLHETNSVNSADMYSMSSSLFNASAAYGKVASSMGQTNSAGRQMDTVIKGAAQGFALLQGATSSATSATQNMAGAASTMSSRFQQVGSVFRAASSAMTTAVKLLASGLVTAVGGLRKFANTIASVTGQIIQHISQVKKLSGSYSSLNVAGNLLKGTMSALGAVSVGKMLAESAKAAINYVEVLNLFNVALRDSIDAGKQFVDQMAENYGIDPSNIMKHVGLFYQLSAAMEAPQKASEQLSLGLTNLGVDLSSLFNMNVDQVMDNLVSGVMGMSRTVRKFGMDIRISTLQYEALKLGIKGQVAMMSEASRQGLRYIAMMKQASAIQGDFAKTIESPANQLRILVEQMKRFARAVGSFLIGPLTAVLPYINAVVMAFRMMLEGLSALFGFKPLDFGGSVAGDMAENVTGVGTAADKTAKKLKKMIAPFDELNLMGQKDASGGSGGGAGGLGEALDPAIAAEMERLSYKMTEIKMKANEVRDAILAFAGISFDVEGKIVFNAATLEENLKSKIPQWSNTISAIFRNWTPILQGVSNIAKSILDVFIEMKERVADTFSANNVDQRFADFIDTLPGKLQAVSDWISTNKETIATIATAIGQVGIGLAVWNLVITPLIGIFKILGPLLAGISATTLGWIVIIAAAAAGLVLLWNNSETFRDIVTGAFDSVMSAVKPVLEYLKEQGTIVFENLKAVWETSGKPALDAFMLALSSLGKIFSDLWTTTLKPILSNIGTAFKDLWENHLRDFFTQFIGFIFSLIETFSALISEVAGVVSFLVKVFGPVVGAVIGAVFTIAGHIIGGFIDLITYLITIFRGLITFITGVFTGDWGRAWEGLKIMFTGFTTLIGNVFTTAVDGIKIAFNVFKRVFSGLWSGFWNGISTIFTDIVDGIGSTFQGVIDTVKGAISAVSNIKIPNPFASGGGTGGGGGKGGTGTAFQSTFQIPKYASGGMPSTGQLFYAREAGAELVGSVGGNTAVMNNDQIVSAVSAGVAQAVKAVLGNGGGSGAGSNEYTLMVDSIEFGRAIKKSSVDQQKHTGVAILKT